MRQELYVNLEREYESARIAEINDVPVITVIDAAVPPAWRAQPRRRVAALVGLGVGMILGGGLASLVVMAFMRNWRATVISAVAIPASIISTFGMMRALNFTLNNITMLAMVLNTARTPLPAGAKPGLAPVPR